MASKSILVFAQGN